MLKKIRLLFLGLIVLAGSACVTPTHASSAPNVIITYVQATGTAGPKDELVVLYNMSAQPVDITDWCLMNNNENVFACFDSEHPYSTQTTTRYTLPAYAYATVASQEYTNGRVYKKSFYSLIYEVTNNTSGSIASSAGAITLVNEYGESISSASWPSALTPTKTRQRVKLFSSPDMYAVNNTTADWMYGTIIEPMQSALLIEAILREEGDHDGEDEPGDGSPGGGSLLPPQLTPYITELLPNPAGQDAGNEFIELYNPHLETILLNGFHLRLGFDTPRWFAFPEGAIILPNEYYVLYNNDVKFSLTNTSGKVQLFFEDIPIGPAIEYMTAKDNRSWALIGEEWQYTTVLTPGAVNQASPQAVSKSAAKTSTLKPCAANQYRSPETNRCRRIQTPATPTPCKPGQARNPATNRCRSIAAATKTLTPCKEGQERNPETNRCRTVAKMTKADFGVQGVQAGADNQPKWYYWLTIGLIVVLVLGYAVWEWREDIARQWLRLKHVFKK